jgi:hypothetical protein
MMPEGQKSKIQIWTNGSSSEMQISRYQEWKNDDKFFEKAHVLIAINDMGGMCSVFFR